MDLKRDIYGKLIDWKAKGAGTILWLEGACRTGKTFILKNFASKNYQNCIYINLVAFSGEQYLLCLNKAIEERADKPLHRSLELFKSGFIDDGNTLIIFDEILYSTKTLQFLNQYFRDVSCHIAVASSYPPIASEVKDEQFSNEIEHLVMYTLSFAEFLSAVHDYGLDQIGKRKMKESYYDIYCQIGGYPDVVKTYLETQDIEQCVEILSVIIKNFIRESEVYFDDIVEKQLPEQIIPAIARSIARNVDGFSVLFEYFCNDSDSWYTSETLVKAIKWFQGAHIINIYEKKKVNDEGAPLSEYMFGFLDVGVCTYFLHQAGISPDKIYAIVSESEGNCLFDEVKGTI